MNENEIKKKIAKEQDQFYLFLWVVALTIVGITGLVVKCFG